MADDYACSRLRAEDRKQFEERFLLGEDRKLKLNVSNALHDHFDAGQTPVSPRPRFVKQLHSLFNSNRPVVRTAFGVAMLVLILGSAWLLITKEPRIKDGIKESIKRVARIRRPQPSNAPRESHHATSNSAPEYRETPSPTVETITLSPDVLLESGSAPNINLPASAHDIVRLELDVKPEPSALYQAQLSTIDGQPVVIAKSLKATQVGGNKVDFDVPAGMLKAGDYRITLRRVNDPSTENVASYYFRVR